MKPWIYAAVLALVTGCEVAQEPAASPAPPPAKATSSSSPRAPASQRAATPAPPDFGSNAAALQALKTAVEADDPKSVRHATLWLSQQGAAAVAPTDAEVQNEANPLNYRLACLNVLGFLGPPAAEAILDASGSETPRVRVKAIEMLGNIKPAGEPIIDELIVMLDEPDSAVRRAAVQSLGRMGKAARRAAPKLQAILNSDADDSLRGAAKTALTQVDPRVGFHKD